MRKSLPYILWGIPMIQGLLMLFVFRVGVPAVEATIDPAHPVIYVTGPLALFALLYLVFFTLSIVLIFSSKRSSEKINGYLGFGLSCLLIITYAVMVSAS